MRLFLLISIILTLIGVYFFIPFDDYIEKMRMRSLEIVDKASEPLPKLGDIKELPSSLEKIFEAEEPTPAAEPTASPTPEGPKDVPSSDTAETDSTIDETEVVDREVDQAANVREAQSGAVIVVQVTDEEQPQKRALEENR